MPRIVGAPVKTWNSTIKSQIIDQSARISLDRPYLALLNVIREAQAIIPEDKQRLIPSVTPDTYKWFREGVEEKKRYLLTLPPDERLPHTVGEEGEEDLLDNGVNIFEKLSSTPVTPPVEEETDVPGDMFLILHELVKTLDELKNGPKSELPGLTLAKRDLFTQVQELREELAELTKFVKSVFGGNFVLKLEPVQVNTTGTEPVARQEPSQSKTLSNGDTHTKTILPLGEKPKVVFLNVESGHQKNAIREQLKDYTSSIDFSDIFGLRVPNFPSYDYVIATKKVPYGWVDEAKSKDSPIKDKLVVIPGNVEPMIIKMREFLLSRS